MIVSEEFFGDTPLGGTTFSSGNIIDAGAEESD